MVPLWKYCSLNLSAQPRAKNKHPVWSSDDCQLVILHSHGIHGPFISIYNLQLMNSRQFIQIILNIRSWCFPWLSKIVNHSWFSRIYGVDLSRDLQRPWGWATLLALDPCWRGTIRFHPPGRGRVVSLLAFTVGPLGKLNASKSMPQNMGKVVYGHHFP